MNLISLLDRITKRVDMSAGENACWPWTGHFGQWGSPTIGVTRPGGRKGGASPRRVVWESLHGPLPRTRNVYMSCGRRDCMNPRHFVLEAVDDPVPRFWKNVHRAAGDGCWTWKAARSYPTVGGRPGRGVGYGAFMVSDHKKVAAHRYSWELHFGPIPDGLVVCHRCDHPPCVRPDHLFLGTSKENTADAIAKGRFSRGQRHGDAVRRAKANPSTPRPKRAQYGKKLNPEIIVSIKAAADRGVGRMQNAALHGLSRNTIYRALHQTSPLAGDPPTGEAKT